MIYVYRDSEVGGLAMGWGALVALNFSEKFKDLLTEVGPAL